MSDTRERLPRPDWGRLAFDAALMHYDSVIESFLDDTEGPEGAPYCGCTTCDVREILYGAWPVIERMVDEVRKQAFLSGGLEALLSEVEIDAQLEEEMHGEGES